MVVLVMGALAVPVRMRVLVGRLLSRELVVSLAIRQRQLDGKAQRPA